MRANTGCRASIDGQGSRDTHSKKLLSYPPNLTIVITDNKCQNSEMRSSRLRSDGFLGEWWAMAELSREQILVAVISGRGAAYLRGVDLSKLDLSGAGWLEEADLRQANLSNAILNRANLKGARLKLANLDSANLSGANLERADLSGSKLTTSNLRLANLRFANLEGANLVGAALTKANLEGANLEGADLEGANLEAVSFKNAVLNRANLKMANLRWANLEGASISETILDRVEAYGSHPAADTEGFIGSVNAVKLMDLVQLLCLSRSDVLIRLESSLRAGSIQVRSGQVCHAEADGLWGEDAFYEMVRWETGHFEMQPLMEYGSNTIKRPLEHLLIEALRRRDERESAVWAEEEWPNEKSVIKDDADSYQE